MTQKVIRKGNLEYRENPTGATGTQFNVVLLRCPICGIEFKSGLHRSQHISTHNPEEFGLSPVMNE